MTSCEKCGAKALKPRKDGVYWVGTFTESGELRGVPLCRKCLNIYESGGNEFRPNDKSVLERVSDKIKEALNI